MDDVLYRVHMKDQDPLAPERAEQATLYHLKASGVQFAIGIQDTFQVTEMRWEKSTHDHGGETTMHARVEGHEGAKLQFVVEHNHGGSWQHYATVPATVKDGVAVGTLKVHHPVLPPQGDLPKAGEVESAKPAQLRFKVERAG